MNNRAYYAEMARQRGDEYAALVEADDMKKTLEWIKKLGGHWDNRSNELSLSHTSATDISPLAKFTALKRLYLSYTTVADVSPLAGLLALKVLDLSYTSVMNLMPLAGCTALKRLFLEGASVADEQIAPLRERGVKVYR